MFKFGSKSDINAGFKCTVRLLDDAEILECTFHITDKGSNLLDYICEQLNVVEKDYFGLRYVDSSKQRHWLELSKPIIKQIKDVEPVLFNFRVKFYPPDPFKLKEDITRYHLFLQLKRDLVHGRLYCTPQESAILAAYIIQGEFGDYVPEEHGDNYIAAIKLLLKQTPQIEDKIMEIHQEELRGQDATTAEHNFLRKAVTLDTYGVDPHPVKDHKGNQLYLGINYQGILTFQGICKLHHFRWPEVHKLKFEGKMFIIHLIYREDARSKKKHTVGFKCPSVGACRHVWRCAIEQMLFFTLPSSSSIPSVITGGSLFSFGTKFRYSGRVEKEVLEDAGRDDKPAILRSNSLKLKASSVPDTPLTPLNNEIDSLRHTPQSELHGYAHEEFLNPEHAPVSTSHARSNVRSSLSDYFFHESLGHSYSESHLMRVAQRSARYPRHMPLLPTVNRTVPATTSSASRISGRSQTPTLPPAPSTSSSPGPTLNTTTPIHTPATPTTKFHFMKVFWPSFIVAAFLVIVIIIVLLETDSEAFRAIRQMPEMVTLRIHYYEHIKQYFKLIVL